MEPSFPTFHFQSFCQVTWLYVYFLFLLSSFFFFFTATNCSASQISYSDHCASIVPEAQPTFHARSGSPIGELATSYFRGGEKFFGKQKSTDQFFNSSDLSLTFYTIGDIYETKTSGIYKVQANLRFRLPYSYVNYSGYGQNYHPRRSYRRRALRFLLNGFFSEDSRKLCMVGKASLISAQGMPLNLEAVFVLNYAQKNSTLFTSLAKGSLKSLSSSDSQDYFDPIEIVSFPVLYDYKYTLASKGLGGGCLGGNNVPPKQSLSLESKRICSMFSWRSHDFELENTAKCKNSIDCSPFTNDTAYLSIYAFQCMEDEEKLRYTIAFQNSFGWRYRSLDPKTTLIGEGSWDSEKNQLCIVACRILNPFKSLEDVRIGDCSMRLSIRFPVVWTIKESSGIVGTIWTNKTSSDPGYFESIRISSSNNYEEKSPGLKYEYTQIGEVSGLCPRKEAVKKNGDSYPNGNSYDMRFDVSVKHNKEDIGWGNGVPISVNDDLYGVNSEIILDAGYGEVEESTRYTEQKNISYKLTLSYYFNAEKQFGSLNSSLNRLGQLVISAEGVYDAETGHLCMVGCRELNHHNTSENSLDCKMLIEVDFPPVNARDGRLINGTIQSRRAKTDPLYFEQLNIFSSSLYTAEVKEAIWRMDLEIIMVLISKTLACIFVAFQLFYVKKHPDILPSISLVMLTILTLGHTIPLVVNLEAFFFKGDNQKNVVLRGEGWLELNEMSLRLVTLIVFLLLLRLLQLAWTSRKLDGNGNHFWTAEKKTAFVSLLLFAVGGLVTLLVELGKNGNENGTPPSPISVYNSTASAQSAADMPQQSYTLRYLKSYAGLVLDGFLFPQIIFNIFHNSRDKALSCSFYIGTTLVRLVPHAYDFYRNHNYIRQDYYGSYVYADHSTDFYSIAWDLIIPCGCIVLAVIIWLQQRLGGRCILPRKFRELAVYEKVPVVSTE